MKKIVNINRVMVFLFLLGLVAVTSCEEQENVSPSSTDEVGEGAFVCAANVTLTGTPIPDTLLGDYCTPGRLTFFPALCTPAPVLAFEGQFNSFIRPLSTGWFIGTIPLTQYNNSWSTMTITTKAGNLGILPNASCSGFTATTDNVVGVDGEFPPFSGDDYGLGYYNYQIGVPTVQTAVVVWRGGSATDPSGATEGFAIRVNALNAIPGPDTNPPPGPDFFTPQVEFDYRKAL